MADINYEEWQAALSLPFNDPDALTCSELADVFGIKPRTLQKRLKALVVAGKLYVTRKVGKDCNGHRVLVPAYGLVKKEPESGGPKPARKVRSKR